MGRSPERHNEVPESDERGVVVGKHGHDYVVLSRGGKKRILVTTSAGAGLPAGLFCM